MFRFAIVAVALVTATSCTSLNTPPSSATFTLVTNAFQYLELEPCGCMFVNIGGLPREYNVLQKRLGQADYLHFLVGTSFQPFQEEKAKKLPPSHLELKRDALAAILKRMHITAITPSDEDAELGKGVLNRLREKASVLFLSANLKDTRGKLAFQPYKLFNKGAASLFVTGISGNGNSKQPSNATGFMLDPWSKALEEMVTQAKNLGHSLVVVLSTLRFPERKEFAAKHPDIKFVFIGGASGDLETFSADVESPNLVFQKPLERGRSVSMMEISFPRVLQGPFDRAHPPVEAETLALEKAFEQPANEVTSEVSAFHKAVQEQARKE